MITLLEKILHWEFASTTTTTVLPGTFAKNDADDDIIDKEDGPGAIKKTYTLFPKAWQPTVANTDVLWLFFMVSVYAIGVNGKTYSSCPLGKKKTYAMVQNDDTLGHRCRQILIQLAGFTNEFFNNDINATRQYATTMVHGVLRLMTE